jgi:hypothetical protein
LPLITRELPLIRDITVNFFHDDDIT